MMQTLQLKSQSLVAKRGKAVYPVHSVVRHKQKTVIVVRVYGLLGAYEVTGKKTVRWCGYVGGNSSSPKFFEKVKRLTKNDATKLLKNVFTSIIPERRVHNDEIDDSQE